jgi:hypothetical protein
VTWQFGLSQAVVFVQRGLTHRVASGCNRHAPVATVRYLKLDKCAMTLPEARPGTHLTVEGVLARPHVDEALQDEREDVCARVMETFNPDVQSRPFWVVLRLSSSVLSISRPPSVTCMGTRRFLMGQSPNNASLALAPQK